ncbi:hypothetical protein BDZ91DRAFT_803632 [Kalaharituber pfeilii]|nr:hypothetical protein BDZ91DRAFT_803632 [Kalaharituber pfeilii]
MFRQSLTSKRGPTRSLGTMTSFSDFGRGTSNTDTNAPLLVARKACASTLSLPRSPALRWSVTAQFPTKKPYSQHVRHKMRLRHIGDRVIPIIDNKDQASSQHSTPEEPELEEDLSPPKALALTRSFLAVWLGLWGLMLYGRHRRTMLFMEKAEELKKMEEEKQDSGGIDSNGKSWDVLKSSDGGGIAIMQAKRKAGERGPEASVLQAIEGNTKFDILKFMIANFTYTPNAMFPVQGADFRPWTAITSAFMHSSIIHLICCYVVLRTLTPDLAFKYGNKRFVGLYFAGAALGGFLQGFTEYLVNPASKMTAKEVRMKLFSKHSDLPKDEKQTLARYFQKAVGSSVALAAIEGNSHLNIVQYFTGFEILVNCKLMIFTLIGVVTALSVPHLRVSVMFLPIAFPIRTAMAGLCAFDFIGEFLYNPGFNIGHGGHLAGYAAGMLLWLLWFRRVPPTQAFQTKYMRFVQQYLAQQSRQNASHASQISQNWRRH